MLHSWKFQSNWLKSAIDIVFEKCIIYQIIQFEKYSFKAFCCLAIYLVIGVLSRLVVVPLLLFSCCCFCALSLCPHNIRLFQHLSSKKYLLQPNQQYLIHDLCIQPGFAWILNVQHPHDKSTFPAGTFLMHVPNLYHCDLYRFGLAHYFI